MTQLTTAALESAVALEAVDDFVYYCRFSGAGASGYSNNQHRT